MVTTVNLLLVNCNIIRANIIARSTDHFFRSFVHFLEFLKDAKQNLFIVIHWIFFVRRNKKYSDIPNVFNFMLCNSLLR